MSTFAVGAVLMSACGAPLQGGSTATSSSTAQRASTTAVTVTADENCLDPSVTPYRSRFTETTDGYQSQVMREIEGDNAQWILTYPVTEKLSGGSIQAQVIVGEEVWNLEGETWEPFPVVPLRWPLLVWVNGYVTGKGVASNFPPGETDTVAGIPTTIYRGGITEMTDAFPGKMRGREFVDELTSYTYWVDDCGDLLKAEIRIELGGEERSIAADIDLPTAYYYDYIVYDVGADFTIEPPKPGYLPMIPPPTG